MKFYEKMTFEFLMSRALSTVSNDVDKRQGSIIWDALAPAVAEMTQIYIELDHVLELTFAESSYGEWLEMRCAEMGIHREAATKAVRLGKMYDLDGGLIDIPIGARFYLDDLIYVSIEAISKGQYKMQCEQNGTIGNKYFGKMIPVDYIARLVKAELSEVITPGEGEENDTSLYTRYVAAVNSTPYGGNIDDYKQKVNALPGIGNCKIVPVWMGGGTVRVVLITTEYKPPSEALVAEVQAIICPIPHFGKGIAPIGHDVTVAGVTGVTVDFACSLTFKSGLSVGNVQEEIEEILQAYFTELAASWADEEYLIVRINQLEARILNIVGILDIAGTTLNGGSENIALGSEEIPLLGTVKLHG